MPDRIEGGCQCGFVRYVIEGQPGSLAVCHCNGCQRQSGSAFGMTLLIEARQLTLSRGELESFEVDCDSGRRKTCSFCPECGVRIHHATDELELAVKAGTLDDRSWLSPQAHYGTAPRQPCVELPAGVPLYPDDD